MTTLRARPLVMSRFDFDPYPTISPASIPLASENVHASPEMFGGLVAGAE